MDEKSRRPMTISEAAHALNVTDQTVRKALLRGELKGFKIGKFWRITPKSVVRKLTGEAPE